jgi:Zn-dependent peptidase ImmA (M78 family)
MNILVKEGNINKEVQNLLTNYWNGIIPVDVFSMANVLGISIYYETLDKGICSLLKKNGNAINLLVNNELSLLKKRFIVAHNIGHYALHLKNELNEIIDGIAIFKYSIGKESREYEANKFAANHLFLTTI